MSVNEEELQASIEKCLEESDKAANGNHKSEDTEKTAALFLSTSLKLSYYMEEIEFNQKTAKNEIARIEAEKYSQLKDATLDKKMTEATLANFVAKDPDVVEVKRTSARAEAALKKWTYLINNLKDGHIFFRGINKTNKSWE